MFYCVRVSSRFGGRGHIVGKGETDKAAFVDAFASFYDQWKKTDPRQPFELASGNFFTATSDGALALAELCGRCSIVYRTVVTADDDKHHDPSL